MFVTTSVAQHSNFVAKPILKYIKLYLESPDTKKYEFIAHILRKFFNESRTVYIFHTESLNNMTYILSISKALSPY